MQGDLEFNVEVSIMAGLHHPNLLPLLGSCCEADQRVAVFQYMPHGNLRDLLDSKTAVAHHFNWSARLNVLLGVAKGLEYLHDVGRHPTVSVFALAPVLVPVSSWLMITHVLPCNVVRTACLQALAYLG